MSADWVLGDEFTEWSQNVSNAVERMLGKDSDYLEKLNSINYYPFGLSASTLDQEFDDSFMNGVNQALDVVRSAIQDYQSLDAEELEGWVCIYKTDCSTDAMALQELLQDNSIISQFDRFGSAELTWYSAPTNARQFGISIDNADLEFARLILLRNGFTPRVSSVSARPLVRVALLLTIMLSVLAALAGLPSLYRFYLLAAVLALGVLGTFLAARFDSIGPAEP